MVRKRRKNKDKRAYELALAVMEETSKITPQVPQLQSVHERFSLVSQARPDVCQLSEVEKEKLRERNEMLERLGAKMRPPFSKNKAKSAVGGKNNV
jgi:hypothetical protein